MLDWHWPSLSAQIYYIKVDKKGKTVISCTLFQRRYLMGILLYAQILINLHQKLLTTSAFGWALWEVWIMEASWMLFVSESTLQNTPIVAQRAEFGKHTRDWGALGHWHTREASLVSNSRKHPRFWSFAVAHTGTFGAAPQKALKIPATHSTVFKTNWKLCWLYCKIPHWNVSEVSSRPNKAIRCLWDSSVTHFKPRGFCFSSTVLSLIFKMDSGTSPNEVWVTQPKYFTCSDAKDWGWPVCGTRTGFGLQGGFFLVPKQGKQITIFGMLLVSWALTVDWKDLQLWKGLWLIRAPGIFLPTKWNNSLLWPKTPGFINRTM